MGNTLRHLKCLLHTGKAGMMLRMRRSRERKGKRDEGARGRQTRSRCPTWGSSEGKRRWPGNGGSVGEDFAPPQVFAAYRKDMDGAENEEEEEGKEKLLLFVGCLTSQQHTSVTSVSQRRMCSENVACCDTEVSAADQTFYLTQSLYTDTGPPSPNVDAITPGAWQGKHWSVNSYVTGMTRSGKIPSQAGFEPWVFCSRGGRLNR